MEENREPERKEYRVRRIGTATFGGMLILFGILFLLHIVVPGISYDFIFRLWPVLFISLGVEILLGNAFVPDRFVYDGLAMVLLVFFTLFAMGLAAADTVFRYAQLYGCAGGIIF